MFTETTTKVAAGSGSGAPGSGDNASRALNPPAFPTTRPIFIDASLEPIVPQPASCTSELQTQRQGNQFFLASYFDKVAAARVVYVFSEQDTHVAARTKQHRHSLQPTLQSPNYTAFYTLPPRRTPEELRDRNRVTQPHWCYDRNTRHPWWVLSMYSPLCYPSQSNIF